MLSLCLAVARQKTHTINKQTVMEKYLLCIVITREFLSSRFQNGVCRFSYGMPAAVPSDLNTLVDILFPLSANCFISQLHLPLLILLHLFGKLLPLTWSWFSQDKPE